MRNLQTFSGAKFKARYFNNDVKNIILTTDIIDHCGLKRIDMGLNVCDDTLVPIDMFPFDSYYCELDDENVKLASINTSNHNHYYVLRGTIPDDALVYVYEYTRYTDKTSIRIKTNMLDIHSKEIMYSIENVKRYGGRGLFLECVPEEHKTKKVCEYFVKRFGNELQYVPNALKTLEMCNMAIVEGDVNMGCDYPHSINYVPEELIDMDLCKTAILHDQLPSSQNCSFPKKFLNYELWFFAIKNSQVLLRFVPDEFKTEELCNVALDNEVCQYFSSVPSKYHTEKSIEKYLKYGKFIKGIPSEYLSHENYKTLMCNGMDPAFVPKELIDFDMSCQCMTNCYLYLIDQYIKFIPKEHLDKNILTIILDRYIQAIEEEEILINRNNLLDVLSNMPDDLWDTDLVTKSIVIADCTISHIPEKFITVDIAIKCLRNGVYLPKYAKYIKNAKYEDYVSFASNSNSLEFVPKEYIDKKMCRAQLKGNAFDFNHIPEELMDYDMYSYGICNGRISFGDKTLEKKFFDKDLLKTSMIHNVCISGLTINPDWIDSELYMMYCRKLNYRHAMHYMEMPFKPQTEQDRISMVVHRTSNIKKILKKYLTVNIIKAAVMYHTASFNCDGISIEEIIKLVPDRLRYENDMRQVYKLSAYMCPIICQYPHVLKCLSKTDAENMLCRLDAMPTGSTGVHQARTTISCSFLIGDDAW
jgi:hypothetical protein